MGRGRGRVGVAVAVGVAVGVEVGVGVGVAAVADSEADFSASPSALTVHRVARLTCPMASASCPPAALPPQVAPSLLFAAGFP
jgi:hypothetical protein